MRGTTVLTFTVLLAGCATAELTPEGSGVIAMWQTESAGMLGNCDRLGTFTANSASVFGGVIGQPQAVADAKNKAAAMGGDTVVLTNLWEDLSGSHVNGVAYRCHGASPKKVIVSMAAPAPRQSAPAAVPAQSNKYDDLKKLEELRATGVITQDEFELEKKKILAR